jgi:hypothetical protein
MTAIPLIVGAAASSVLLAAIVLDSIVSARASEPAPKQFSLFLRLFLFFQMIAFVLSALAAESGLASDVWERSRSSHFFLFVLEDPRRGFSAVLVWYLPRFLFVSLGLVYSWLHGPPVFPSGCLLCSSRRWDGGITSLTRGRTRAFCWPARFSASSGRYGTFRLSSSTVRSGST